MKNKTIAIEFDNTITAQTSLYPKLGVPNRELVNKIREWYKDNTIIIWTTRAGRLIDPMIRYLEYYDIPFDFINSNPGAETIFQSRKIHADVFIDNRSVNLDFMGIDTIEKVAKLARKDFRENS